MSVRLRPLGRHDVVGLRDALAAGTVAETTRRLFPRSLPSMLDWYDKLQSSREMSPFAIAINTSLIGYCALRPPVYSGRELVIAIFDPRWHGKGVGTLAVREMCTFGFGTLKLQRIELGVYPTNQRAISCYERCGFREEALLRKFVYHEGAWVDLTLMSLLRPVPRWDSLEESAPSRARAINSRKLTNRQSLPKRRVSHGKPFRAR